jgi:hypothetical protein
MLSHLRLQRISVGHVVLESHCNVIIFCYNVYLACSRIFVVSCKLKRHLVMYVHDNCKLTSYPNKDVSSRKELSTMILSFTVKLS